MIPNMNATAKSFDEALAAFVVAAQALVDAHYARHYPTQGAILSVERGKRYARIVTSSKNGVSRSVYCFVDSTNGDVLKAASWKAPAKHARGNIYAADVVAGLNEHGARYL
jgi:hypothetical protein